MERSVTGRRPILRYMGTRSSDPKPKGKIWIRNQARSFRLGYPKLLAVNADVNRRPGERAVAEERVDGDNDEDDVFLPFGPLRKESC